MFDLLGIKLRGFSFIGTSSLMTRVTFLKG
jgi:hypothetical protein